MSGVCFERGGEALEIRRLMDLGVGYRRRHRLAQRAENKRMIVGDQHPDRVSQSRFPPNSAISPFYDFGIIAQLGRFVTLQSGAGEGPSSN